uniref:Spondin domain-containing protein n=1 Tax=Clastoptera arizonana TaxID=38151 RepID=A0A1B6CB16_9HEMI
MLSAACVFLLAATVTSSVSRPPVDVQPCLPDKLTAYRLVMHTFWTRELFPKHYPDWRPPAQWSRLVGRSHDSTYTLYRLGTRATPSVKAMAETGHSDLLEAQNQGEGGILDVFNAPPISTGSGRTETEFFVDGNHTTVSLMSRIIPSPDWFVGVDSFNLCVDGNWLDSITIEVDPIDAGTDNGFTFTAPNWMTDPQGVIYKITSRYPSHPAGSFYYPYIKRLPPIATFQFIKAREYELSEVFHHTEDDKRYELLKLEREDSVNVINNNDQNNDIQVEMEAERREQEMRNQQQLATRLPVTSQIPLTSGVVPRGDKDAILNSIVETYHNEDIIQKTRKTARKYRLARDCRVGEWGDWSLCSKSCGVGEMTRRREVVKHSRRGGKPCSPLLETKWCGSAQDCTQRPSYSW